MDTDIVYKCISLPLVTYFRERERENGADHYDDDDRHYHGSCQRNRSLELTP